MTTTWSISSMGRSTPASPRQRAHPSHGWAPTPIAAALPSCRKRRRLTRATALGTVARRGELAAVGGGLGDDGDDEGQGPEQPQHATPPRTARGAGSVIDDERGCRFGTGSAGGGSSGGGGETDELALQGVDLGQVPRGIVITAALAGREPETAARIDVAGAGTTEVNDRGQVLLLAQAGGADPVALERARDGAIEQRGGPLDG